MSYIQKLNSSQAREDKIQLGYHWKNGRFVIKTQKNLDFTNTTSRLDTAYLKRDLLETNFQQTYFFAPYFEIDFQSKWEEFNFEQEEIWEGERLTSSLNIQLVLKNSYFFFNPSLQFIQKNYQASYNTTDIESSPPRNFSVETFVVLF